MSAADSYVENEVLTATPQKLRLLLIDGAIRFAHASIRQWEEGRNDEALEAVIRCREIVTELFSVIDKTASGPAAQVYDLYVFLFGELTEAQRNRDSEQVRGVLRVLEVERETWRQVCEQLPESPVPPHHFQAKEITAAAFPAETVSGFFPSGPAASFSIDA
jgi:flagellar protein FliS